MGSALDGIKSKMEAMCGVFGDNVVSVSKKEKDVVFKGVLKNNIKEEINRYFNLSFNYEEVKEKLSLVDVYLKTSTKYGHGIRILKQDLWETIISFIISANNNIPRIKGIIERISKKYGQKIVWKNKEYYTFPTPCELGKASVKDLRELGLGFRDIRVYKTTKMVLDGTISLEKIEEEENLEVLNENLLKIPGVGPKVANCIMLFALSKIQVFPIDVWVNRVMNELYGKDNILTKKQIEQIAKDKYGDLAGLAQQYLFYWKRETK